MIKDGVDNVLYVSLCDLIESRKGIGNTFVEVSATYGGSFKIVVNEVMGYKCKVVTLYRLSSRLPVHEIIITEPLEQGSGKMTVSSRAYSRGKVNLGTAESFEGIEIGAEDIFALIKVVRNVGQKWALVKLLNTVL